MVFLFIELTVIGKDIAEPPHRLQVLIVTILLEHLAHLACIHLYHRKAGGGKEPPHPLKNPFLMQYDVFIAYQIFQQVKLLSMKIQLLPPDGGNSGT